MFTEFMIFVALMFVFMLIFIGMMEWEEPPAVMFSIFLAIVGASMYGSSDSEITIESGTKVVQEINATSLQNVVDEFQERIVKLEERKCTCEPTMVIAPVETPDPYGTGY